MQNLTQNKMALLTALNIYSYEQNLGGATPMTIYICVRAKWASASELETVYFNVSPWK